MIRTTLKTLLALIIFALLFLAGYLYYRHSTLYPSTDDAYVQAHVIYIAPRINGKVERVAVHNHQKVKKGQVLFSIDSKPYQLQLQAAIDNLHNTQQQIKVLDNSILEAQAAVKQRQAELENIQQQTRRTLTLVKQKLSPAANADTATSQLKVAEQAVYAAKQQLKEAIAKRGKIGPMNAMLQTALNQIQQAKLNLSYTIVTAPSAGYLVKMSLQKGSVVNAYQQTFALISSHDWWVSANFKETQLARIHVGQPVTIKLDMYPDMVFSGNIISLSSGSGASFSLLPPENATGNWVKVTQRFPVWVSIHDKAHFPLRLGASGTVQVNTSGQTRAS